jgi:hypothetical protein
MPARRIACVALAIAGCHHAHEPASDAQPILDSPVGFCSSADGSANLVLQQAGPAKTYDRLYAGGVWLTGPVRASGAPFQLELVFANTSPISQELGVCCEMPSSSCCAIDAIAASIDSLPDGGEVGSHPVTVNGASFMVSGTLTITDWMHPFLAAPGRIAGSLSVVTNTITIDGMFDNQFCAEMLTATI